MSLTVQAVYTPSHKAMIVLNIPFIQPKVAILKWPIPKADSCKFRGIGHNLEELARSPLSIRKISENDKIATFIRLCGMYQNTPMPLGCKAALTLKHFKALEMV